MDEGQKPFACEVKGCEMTFTNEDHLNWHKKKHDMVLNLGLANKNTEVADQTPTPTRFIRNCEEVGLFQDLQNVNPFDEFFKKAVEIKKSGGTLEVHEINSDDTLHTPHILPHIEESQKKNTPTNSSNEDHNSHSDFSLNDVILVTSNCDENVVTEHISEHIIEIHEVSKQTDNILTSDNKNNNILTSATSEHQIQRNDVKLKIKQTLQVRSKQKNLTANETNKNLLAYSSSKPKLKFCSNSPSLSTIISKEKIRAMNRAAQDRCRKRKAQRWQEMEKELEQLKVENKRLKSENILLKKELLIMGNILTSDSLNKNTEGTGIF